MLQNFFAKMLQKVVAKKFLQKNVAGHVTKKFQKILQKSC